MYHSVTESDESLQMKRYKLLLQVDSNNKIIYAQQLFCDIFHINTTLCTPLGHHFLCLAIVSYFC